MLVFGETALREKESREHEPQDRNQREGNEELHQGERLARCALPAVRTDVTCSPQHIVQSGEPEAMRLRSIVTESALNSAAIGAITILIV